MLTLPHTTIVDRNIPKNSFEAYTNTRQRKLLATHIDKIRWANKLSKQTIKLEGDNIQEIQIFTIQLKQKDSIDALLDLIDKCIPYHIIFVLNFEGDVLFSTAQKHLHPTIDNTSVIDWRFNSTWMKAAEVTLELNLKNNLDNVFADFCSQLSNRSAAEPLENTIVFEKSKTKLLDEIEKLESAIKKCKQFNLKVELNIQLQNKKRELEHLVS